VIVSFNTGATSLGRQNADFSPEGPPKEFSVRGRPIDDVVRELNLARVDVIKIDTEGSEYDILTSLGHDFLGKVKWIYGELHGNRDFELLAFLSEQFDIGVKKTMDKRLFMFQARNKTTL